MADIDDRARLKMMSVKELLAEAKARGIPTKDLLEKSEIIDALAAASFSAPAGASSSGSSSFSSSPPAMSESMPIQIEFEHSWLRALSPNWNLECRQLLTTFGSLSHWQERFELYKLASDAMSRPHALKFKGERQYNLFYADLTNFAGLFL